MMQFLMSRLQASAISWSSFSACRNSRGLPTETARVKAWTCSIPLSTFSMDMRNPGSSITRKMKMLFRIWPKAFKAIFLIAYRHGLRASEVGMLRTEDIDFQNAADHDPQAQG